VRGGHDARGGNDARGVNDARGGGGNDVPLKVVDTPRGPPLERYKDAVRDTKPAWMTKGFGVGVAILGESTGELVKPGMTKTDLERIESDSKIKPKGDDPFADIFAETSSGAAALAKQKEDS